MASPASIVSKAVNISVTGLLMMSQASSVTKRPSSSRAPSIMMFMGRVLRCIVVRCIVV